MKQHYLTCFALVALGAPARAQVLPPLPATLTTPLGAPAAPKFEIKGTPGKSTIYYWAYARDARGHSNLSSPAVVPNAPDTLSAQNAVVLTVAPVPGATEYGIISSRILAPPELKFDVKKKGEHTFYYWMQARNGPTVYSPISGPFKVEGSAVVPDIDLSWPETGAQKYFIYRSDNPARPIGWRNVALAAGLKTTRFNDAVPVPVSAIIRPDGNLADAPQGEGNYLVGVSNGTPIVDSGQALGVLTWYDVNTTDPRNHPFKPDIVAWDQGEGQIHQFTSQPSMPTPQASWNHIEGLSVLQRNMAGGINRQPIAGSEGGNIPQESAKNTNAAIAFHQFNMTASEKTGLLGYTQDFSVGDYAGIVFSNEQYGQNRDGGDEGSEYFSLHMNRHLSMNQLKITADAGVGDTTLKTDGTLGVIAAGRGIVNLTRAYSSGAARVSGVSETMNGESRLKVPVAVGTGTNWTPAMEGWWISFDADTVDGWHGKVRQWYRVDRYLSPTRLKLFAYTYWSTELYKGHALKNGPYLLCPYTEMADGDSLNSKGLRVIPLATDWKAGDNIEIMAGPQTTMRLGWWEFGGEFLPQDHVAGLGIMYSGNKDPSEGALIVYGNDKGRWPSALEMHNLKGGLSFDNVDTGLIFYDNSNTILQSIFPDSRYALVKDENGIYLDGQAGKVGRYVGLTTDGLAVYKGGLQGNERTRGQSIFSGDGKKTEFTIKFAQAHPTQPFIVASSNLPLGMGVSGTTLTGCTVTFSAPPAAGTDNIVVTWMVQE